MDVQIEIRRCRELVESARVMCRHVQTQAEDDEDETRHVWRDQRGRAYLSEHIAGERNLLDDASTAIRHQGEAIEASQPHVTHAEETHRATLTRVETIDERLADAERWTREGEDGVTRVRKEAEKLTTELNEAATHNAELDHDPGW